MMAESTRRAARAGAVTRADVARLAGVSTAVVSYVVNGGPKPVAEVTAARVQDAISRLGYRPNRTARALALGSTRTLGLVVPDSTNAFYAEYAHQIQRAAGERGYALLMTNSGFDPDVELRGMLDLCDRQIDGLILARWSGGERLGELTRSGVGTRVVLIDSTTPLPGYATIGPEAARGVAAAVEHLLVVHHHAQVAMVIGDSVESGVDGRRAGWMEAHARAGRHLGALEQATFDRPGGYAAGLRLLQREDRPTAVIASSDLQAVGVLRAAHELDVRVPEDLAVASYDGTAETEFCWPSLTTIRQPTPQMAEAAVAAVLSADQTAHQTFAMDLVLRRSCGCPRP